MENLNKHPNKSTYLSLRLPTDVKLSLDADSKKEQVNVNMLVNRLLAKHVSFDRIADQLDMVPINRALLCGLVEGCPQDIIEQLGKELGPRVAKHTFSYLGRETTLDNLIEAYIEPMGLHSKWFVFSAAMENSKKRLVFKHSYGEKWSRFLSQYLVAMVKTTTKFDPKFESDDEMVVIYC
jgi:hypothetical protein